MWIFANWLENKWKNSDVDGFGSKGGRINKKKQIEHNGGDGEKVVTKKEYYNLIYV